MSLVWHGVSVHFSAGPFGTLYTAAVATGGFYISAQASGAWHTVTCAWYTDGGLLFRRMPLCGLVYIYGDGGLLRRMRLGGLVYIR